jgi:dethiobiotin synthetase
MTARYFVTGTDTGVGKSLVAAGLLAAARRRGHRVAALKPAESGCDRGPDGTLQAADAALLRAAAGLEVLPLEAVAPHRYLAPVAPGVAARREGPPFSVDRVKAALGRLLADEPHLLLVEGAGGLLVPYSDTLLEADLVATLGLPLLIVARAGLGTINHTLLTVFEARRRGLTVAGVILNRVEAERSPSEAENAAEIGRLGEIQVLGTVPHLAVDARTDLARLAAAVEASLPVSALIDRSLAAHAVR